MSGQSGQPTGESLQKLCTQLVRERSHSIIATLFFSLFQARVENFLGTIVWDEMFNIFSVSREAQNFWHYLAMSSMPDFNLLTSRWSR